MHVRLIGTGDVGIINGNLHDLKALKVVRIHRDRCSIEFVDRLTLTEKLQRRLEYENRTMNAYIQVNISYEPSQFGVAPEKT